MATSPAEQRGQDLHLAKLLPGSARLLGTVLVAQQQYAEAIEDLEFAVATLERSGRSDVPGH
jgi:hypothetical protein